MNKLGIPNEKSLLQEMFKKLFIEIFIVYPKTDSDVYIIYFT